MRPPPGGMPRHMLRTSAAQLRRIGSSCRGPKRRSGNDSGAVDAAVFDDGDLEASSAPVAEPPRPASASWHLLETSAVLRSRHCSAARLLGCTPEQCEMKSDLQAARMALICFALGCRVSVGRGAAAPGGGGTATVVGEAGAAEAAGGDGLTTAGAVSETGAAAAPVRRTFWQAAESCAASAILSPPPLGSV